MRKYVSNMLSYEGENFFRQRIVLSCLSGKSIYIKNIRAKSDNPGLKEHEANFIKLIDKLSNGSVIEVNDTGTAVTFRPGFLLGGKLKHDCPLSRGIGYILEPLIMLAPYCKHSLDVTLNGVTNNEIDPTIDMIIFSLLPVIKKFLINDEDLSIKLIRRGLPPLGGGVVKFTCPVIKNIKAFQWLDIGKVKKIRGIAYTSRGPPNNTNRMMEAAKEVFFKYLTDVYFTVDNSKGLSPGYGVCPYAETNKGVYISSEAMRAVNSGSNTNDLKQPEDIGKESAWRLLEEIWSSGCVDSFSQTHLVLFMTLASRDVSKAVFGPLTTQTMYFLRHIKDFFNVTFKIDEYKGNLQLQELEEASEDNKSGSSKLLLTCVGIGFNNVNKPQV